jgi:hypothetical protein
MDFPVAVTTSLMSFANSASASLGLPGDVEAVDLESLSSVLGEKIYVEMTAYNM